MTLTEKLLITAQNTCRLDKCIAEELSSLSRSKIQKLILNQHVKVDEKIVSECSYQVKIGNVIELNNLEEKKTSIITPKDIPFKIIYEDNYLLVIDKPAGLTVHPGAGNKDDTLVNALVHHCGGNLPGDSERPGIVHRLDRDTTGLMITAKTEEALQNLSQSLANREIKRIYNAVIYGLLTPSMGTIKTPYGRSKTDRKKMSVKFKSDKEAITYYKVLEEFAEHLSLVEFQLETGRTHQIRVHMDYKKTPIVGDQVYGRSRNHNLSNFSDDTKECIRSFPRQALHAKRISFTHPITDEQMNFEIDLPSDMENLIDNIKR